MKNVFLFAMLIGLFIVTTSETCDDCDEVCLDQLEECDSEVQALSGSVEFLSENILLGQIGRICPPPCRGPNPCDICAGCNIANCNFFVNPQITQEVFIQVFDPNGGLIGESEGFNDVTDDLGYTQIFFNGNLPEEGIGTLVITKIQNGDQVTDEIPFDFATTE
jgi:hypothetical protein